MRVYLANKMTDIPQFNYPWFDQAASYMRDILGWEVQSPAEMDDPATRATALASKDGSPGSGTANGETWGDFLARDVKLIADGGIDAIVVGPLWKNSKGALLETFVASQLGKPVLDFNQLMMPGSAILSEEELVEAWAEGLGFALPGTTLEEVG